MNPGFIHEITGRCNLACRFCYNPWRAGGAVPGELSPEENAALLERVLRESEAQWLTFAGGEPLLYEGLEQVMAHLRRRFPGLRMGLATNGILLPARLEGLLAAGLAHVEVPLFASEARTYRALTASDHHDRAPHALALARARGLSVTAATVLRRGMDRELEDILRLARALGASQLSLNRFAPRGLGRVHAVAFLPSPEELDRLLVLADRLAGELHYPVAITTPVEDCCLPHARYPHLAFGACVCGRSKWIIDPEGCLRVCELADVRLGSLRTHAFADLARHPEVARFRAADRLGSCGTCPARSRCGGGCRFTPGRMHAGAANSEHGGGRQ